MSNKYSRKIGPLESAYRNAQSYAADEKDILTRAASAGKDGSASALVAALRRAKAEKAAETERQKSGFERAHDVPESGSSADTIVGAARKFILGECDTIDSIDADKDFASKREKFTAASGSAALGIRKYRDIISRARRTIGDAAASSLEESLSDIETMYRERMQSTAYPRGYMDMVKSGAENPALSYFEKYGVNGDGTGSEDVIREAAAKERETAAAKLPELGQKAHILRGDTSGREALARARTTVESYDKLFSAYEEADRTRKAVREGDTAWLADNGYIELASSDIEKRIGEIEEEIKTLEGQLDMTPEEIERSDAASIRDRVKINREVSKRRTEVHNEIAAKRRMLDKYRAEYYSRENEETKVQLQGDASAAAAYDTAKASEEDAAIADSLLQDYFTSSLGLTYDDARQKYLYDKYGVAIPEVLDEAALANYAAALHELRAKLRGDTSAAADKLAEGGYNYGRISEYDRRLEVDAANKDMQTESAAYAKEHPIAATVQQIAAKPIEMLEGAGMMLRNIGNGDKDAPLSDYVPLYAGDMKVKIENEALNEGAKEKLTESTIKLGMSRDTASSVAGFLYDCGISTVDSAVRATLFGPASLVFAGGNAAADAAKTVADAGGSYGQMVSMGILSGAAEVVFEKVSLDRLLDDSSPHTISRMLKNAAAQSGVEASEEAFTEIANIISNTAVMAENSDFALAVAGYEGKGYTHDEAQRKAFFDALGQVGLSALAGAVSGAPTSILHGSANLVRNKIGDAGVLSYAKKSAAPDDAARAIYNEIESGALEINDDSMTRLREALSDEIRATAEAERARVADKERAAADVQTATEAARAAVEPEENGERRYSFSFSGETSSNETKAVLDIISTNSDKLSSDRVFSVTDDENIGNFQRMSDYVLDVFNSQGNVAHSPQIGDVELTRSGAKSTVMHGVGKEKLAAVKAIKSAIEHGNVISHTSNYSGNGVDRYIIAARGTINGNDAVVGAVIKAYPNNNINNKFYLHEAEIIETGSPLMTAVQSSTDTVSKPVSDTSIPESGENVKPYYEGNGRGEVWNSAVANNEAIIAGKPELAEEYYNIAKAFNVGIEFYDADPEVEGDGFYSGGVIHLNASARDPLGYVFAHELAHHAESSGTYGRLRRMALRELSQSEDVSADELRREVAEEYRGHGVELDARGADAELVARYVQNYLLADESSVQALVSEDVSFARQVLDFIEEFLSRFTPIGNETQRIERGRRMLKAALERAGDGGGEARNAFAGRESATMDASLLQEAIQLEKTGYSSEDIRQKTGWFKSYDGEWRYEIDDLDSNLIENPKLERHNDDGEVYFIGKLSDILDHKELFKAYPELRDINVIIQPTEIGVEGIYQSGSNYITLSLEQFKRYTKEYSEYLNGERQAEIQRIEQTPEYREYSKFFDDDAYDDMDPAEWLDLEKAAMDKFFSSKLGKRYRELVWGKNGFTGEKFEFGWDKGAKAVLMHEIQHAIQNIEGFAGGANVDNENYGRVAGEVEARDVSSRLEYNAEERKNTRPDIDRSDVVFADKGTSYSLRNGAEADVDQALTDLSRRDDVYLTESSPSIIASQKGVRNLPMLMKASHIRENVYTEAEAKKLGLKTDKHTHYHGLGKELFLKIIGGLDDVALAYRGTKNATDPSRRENYFLLISQYKDADGNTVNVPVYINERGQYNRVFIDTNKIATVFGRDDFNDYINRELKNGNLVRIKNKSARASERTAVIAGGYSGNAFTDTTISQNDQSVNSSISENEKNDTPVSDIRYSFSRNSDESRQSEAGEENQIPQGDEEWDAEAREVRTPEWAGRMGVAEYVDKTGGNYIDDDGNLTEGRGTYRRDASDAIRESGAVEAEEDRRAALEKLRQNRRVMSAEELRRRDVDLLADDVVDTLEDTLGEDMTDDIASAIYELSDDVADGKLDADRAADDENAGDTGREAMLSAEEFDYLMTEYRRQADDAPLSEAEELQFAHLREEAEKRLAVRRENEAAAAEFEAQRREMETAMEEARRTVDAEYTRERAEYEGAAASEADAARGRELWAEEDAARQEEARRENEAAAAKKREEAGVSEDTRNLSDDELTALEDVMDRLHDKIEASGISEDTVSEIRARAYAILDGTDKATRDAAEKRAKILRTDAAIETARRGLQAAEDALSEVGEDADTDRRSKLESKKRICEKALERSIGERTALAEYSGEFERLMCENPSAVLDLAFEFSAASKLLHALGISSDEISTRDKSRLAAIDRAVSRMESTMSAEDIGLAHTLADGGYIEVRTEPVLSLSGYYSLKREILAEYAPSSFDALGIEVDTPMVDGLSRAASLRANANLVSSYRMACDRIKAALRNEGKREQIELAYRMAAGHAATKDIPEGISDSDRARVVRLANALMTLDGTSDLIKQNRARAAEAFESDILSDILEADPDGIGVKDVSALRLNLNTPERALRLALPEAVADVIVRRIIHPLTENNRRRDLKINELVGGLRDIINRANAEESAIIQLLNEGGLGMASLGRIRSGDVSEYAARADKIEAEITHREAVARAMELGIMEEIEAGSSEAFEKLRASIEDEIYDRLRRVADEEAREAERLTKLGRLKKKISDKAKNAVSYKKLSEADLRREAASQAEKIFESYEESLRSYVPGEFRKSAAPDTKQLRQEGRAARATAEAITRMNKYLDEASAKIRNKGAREAWRTMREEALLRAADYERETYGKLWDALNDALVTHGYEPIGYIENYAPHTAETRDDIKTELLSKLGFIDEVTELPSDLAGLTAGLRPGKQWSPYLLERQNITGEGVKLDGVGGFEEYLKSTLGIIYHMDDIQKLRSLERIFREEYSPKELRDKISDIKNDMKYGRISEEDGKEKIDALRERDTLSARAGRLATWIQDYANKLANKQILADRAMEHLFGRSTLNQGARLQNMFAASAIWGNMRSALTNGVSVVAAHALAGNRAMVRALFDIATGELNEMYDFDAKSRFLTGKRGLDTALEKNFRGKVADAGGILFDLVDDISVRIAQRALFYKLTDAGMDAETAIDRSDTMAAALIGDRASGTKPLIFESRNFAVKLFTMFQLETTNLVAAAVEDMPKYFRDIAKVQGARKAKRELMAVIMRYLLSAFVFNRIFEEYTGGTPAMFDIIGWTVDSIGAAYGYDGEELVVRLVDDLIEEISDRRLFGSDGGRELEFDAGAGLGEFAQNVIEDIPMAQNLLAIAGIGEARYPMPQISEKLISPKSAAQFGEGALDTLLGIVPGGSQVKKTIKGVSEVARGRSVNTANGRTKYTVERTPGNYIRGALFGPSALDENKAYWAGGDRLSEGDDAAIEDMMNAGMSAADAEDAIKAVKAVGIKDRKEDEEYKYTGDAISDIREQLYADAGEEKDEEPESAKELAALRGLGLSKEAEAAVWYNKIASSKQRVIFDSIAENGGDRNAAYDVISTLSTIWGDNEAYRKITTLEESDLDAEAKAAVYYGTLAEKDDRAVFDTLRDECKESSADIGELMIAEARARVTKYQKGEHKKSEAQLGRLRNSGISDGSKAVYFYEALASDTVRDVMDDLEADGVDLGRCWEPLGEIRAADNAGEKAGALLSADISDAAKEEILLKVISSREGRVELAKDLEELKSVGGRVDNWLAAKAALQGVEGKFNSKGKTVSGTLKKNKRRVIKEALAGEDSAVIREIYDIFGVANTVSKKKKNSLGLGLDLDLGLDLGLGLDLDIK